MRSVPEWIGKTDDAKPPPRVRIRVFERYHGICQLSGRKIMPGDKWELHHLKPLILGGENRESNLVPVLADKHKQETARNVAEKSKTARIRAKHLGLHKPRSSLSSPKWKRKINRETVLR